MTYEIPTMLTIGETAKQTGLAVHYIRKCCLQGKIVHVRCGKRILENFNRFCEYLNSGDQLPENEPQGKIRRIVGDIMKTQKKTDSDYWNNRYPHRTYQAKFPNRLDIKIITKRNKKIKFFSKSAYVQPFTERG